MNDVIISTYNTYHLESCNVLRKLESCKGDLRLIRLN